jgi:hypothetical protein
VYVSCQEKLVIKYLDIKFVIKNETINAIIKSTIDFGPFRFAETLNALYISVTSQIKSKRLIIINDTAITVSTVEILICSPDCVAFDNIYLLNLFDEPEKPMKDTIRYGKRANACVPNTSTMRTEEGEAAKAIK